MRQEHPRQRPQLPRRPDQVGQDPGDLRPLLQFRAGYLHHHQGDFARVRRERPNTEFLNISTNYCLYNVEGFVVEHLSDSIFSVQTRFSLVLCHLGVTYCQRPDDQTFPLPSDHWKTSSMESSLSIGTKVG